MLTCEQNTPFLIRAATWMTNQTLKTVYSLLRIVGIAYPLRASSAWDITVYKLSELVLNDLFYWAEWVHPQAVIPNVLQFIRFSAHITAEPIMSDKQIKIFGCIFQELEQEQRLFYWFCTPEFIWHLFLWMVFFDMQITLRFLNNKKMSTTRCLKTCTGTTPKHVSGTAQRGDMQLFFCFNRIHFWFLVVFGLYLFGGRDEFDW